VHRVEAERLQDQQVERALNEIGRRLVHVHSSDDMRTLT
jgi:hypothetical protein